MGFLGIILLIVIIVLVVAIAIVLWIVKGQKNLIMEDELCGNALSQIGIQQASRWDALTSLIDLTREYSQQEYDNLLGVVRTRQGIDANSSAEKVDEQDKKLLQATNQITALAEAYPDLKSNTLYLKAMDSVREYENNVRMSRMVYNDTVTKYNRMVRSFPGTMIAGNLGFAPREYLQGDSAKADMPDLTK